MLTADALAYYGSMEKMAAAAGVTLEEAKQWRHFVPNVQARKLHRDSRREIPYVRPFWMRVDSFSRLLNWYQTGKKHHV